MAELGTNPGCSSVILACLSASALGSGSSEICASVMYTGLSPSEWDEAEKNWMLSYVFCDVRVFEPGGSPPLGVFS